jgi:hypothetical protein
MHPFAWLLTGCTPILTSPTVHDSAAPWEAPDNHWPSAAPPADLSGEGFDVGDIIPDTLLVDQYGDLVSPWQFWGHWVVLDVSTMWCSPCQQLAGGIQALADAWRPRGVLYLSVFPENVSAQVPTAADLQQWGDTFGITEPLLSDANGWSRGVVPGNAYPGLLIVDPDLRVHARIPIPEDAAIEAALHDALGD